MHHRAGPRLAVLVSWSCAGVLAAGLLTGSAAAGADDERIDRVLLDSRIRESSGIALSTRFSQVLLTHNDSGDGPRVFAVDRAGQTAAVWTLSGAGSRDWEDIATGPGNTVWVGDIGDNQTRHLSIHVYVFDEPSRLADRTVSAEHYELRYPDGRHNAEAMLVRPVSGRLLIVTKDTSGGAVYRAPHRLSTGRTNVLERVADAPATVTGGAVAPAGGDVVLRTYGWAYVYDDFSSRPQAYRLPVGGESVSYTGNGDGLYVGAEGVRSKVWTVPAG